MEPDMSTVTVLRLILETLAARLHRAVQSVCDANMGALAETDELMRCMNQVQHALIGARKEHDPKARRWRLERLRERIARLRERNEHTVGSGMEAACLANTRIKIDDDVLAMIDDAMKGL